jgi:hypothetical protein
VRALRHARRASSCRTSPSGRCTSALVHSCTVHAPQRTKPRISPASARAPAAPGAARAPQDLQLLLVGQRHLRPLRHAAFDSVYGLCLAFAQKRAKAGSDVVQLLAAGVRVHHLRGRGAHARGARVSGAGAPRAPGRRGAAVGRAPSSAPSAAARRPSRARTPHGTGSHDIERRCAGAGGISACAAYGRLPGRRRPEHSAGCAGAQPRRRRVRARTAASRRAARSSA